MVLRSQRHIPKGTEVCISYVSIMQGKQVYFTSIQNFVFRNPKLIIKNQDKQEYGLVIIKVAIVFVMSWKFYFYFDTHNAIKYFTIGVSIVSSLQIFINWFLSRKYMNLGCDPVIYYGDTQETVTVLQIFFFQQCKNVSCVNIGLVYNTSMLFYLSSFKREKIKITSLPT